MKNLSLLFIAFLLLQFNTLAQEGWFEQTSGTTEQLNDVSFTDALTGTAVGEEGTIIRTTDGGTSWTAQSSGTQQQLNGIIFTDSLTGIVVGDEGTILRTTDGGINWIFQFSGTTRHLLGVSFSDSDNGTAVGRNGRIRRTTDGGTSWSSQSTGTNTNFSSVFFVNKDTGWVVGDTDSSHIFKTADGGENWQNESVTGGIAGGGFRSVHFIDYHIGWVAGWEVGLGPGHPKIFKSTDGGESWEPNLWNYSFGGYLNSIFFIDENNGWAVGEKRYDIGVVIRTTAGIPNWIEQIDSMEFGLNDVFFLDENTGWAVGDSGKIIHTTNGGVSFVEEEEIDEIPTDYYLSNNYPNPFNPSTKVRYSVPQTSGVIIKVFDILGNEIETIVSEEKPVGTYELSWNADNLPSGIYFYRLQAVPTGRQAGSFIETKKMVLLR